MPQTSKTRYWNTWSAQSPAIMEFLPSKFCIRPGAYSTKENTYTDFPFTRGVKLLEHHPEGRCVRLEVEHSGTRLEITYDKVDDWTVLGRIRCLEHGEWALRFCPTLSFGFDGEAASGWKSLNTPKLVCRDSGAAALLRSYHFAVAFDKRPVRACLAADPDRVGRDMVSNGYYTPCDDDDDPRWYTASFNLESTPEIRFAVAVSNSDEESDARAAEALALFDRPDALEHLREMAFSALPRQREGAYPEAVAAIRDVMAWNTIADDITGRWFVWITRFWNKKFGGWYVWMDDPYYHGLISAVAGDWQAGRMSIKATVDNNVPQGNFACLMGELTEWVDRSQPPIGSFLVLRYYLFTGDKALLEEVYPALRDAHFWWYEHRDGNGNGVLEYGSSRVGNGHFGQSRLAAMDESSMDNSPMFDQAEYCEETCTMDMEDVALNSLLVLDGESLMQIAQELHDEETAARIAPKVERLRKAADERLWDDERKIYANRHWDKGFVDPSPTSFYPLAAGMADGERADHLLKHMFDETEFWTPAPFPSIWKKSPAFQDNVYWRGRMWPPLNFMTYNGLKRYGFDTEASRLARRCMEVFSARWQEERACF